MPVPVEEGACVIFGTAIRSTSQRLPGDVGDEDDRHHDGDDARDEVDDGHPVRLGLPRDLRGEDEHLAHQVRVPLVARHEADDGPAGRLSDDRLEALAHDLLEGDALA